MTASEPVPSLASMAASSACSVGGTLRDGKLAWRSPVSSVKRTWKLYFFGSEIWISALSGNTLPTCSAAALPTVARTSPLSTTAAFSPPIHSTLVAALLWSTRQ